MKFVRVGIVIYILVAAYFDYTVLVAAFLGYCAGVVYNYYR